MKAKRDDLVYIQRDIEALKHTLDKVLRPYKTDVKRLSEANRSHVENLRRKHRETEELMALIARKAPGLFDDALGVLADPNRRGWKKFRESWYRRMEIATGRRRLPLGTSYDTVDAQVRPGDPEMRPVEEQSR